jgi:hypothetical protein
MAVTTLIKVEIKGKVDENALEKLKAVCSDYLVSGTISYEYHDEFEERHSVVEDL